MTAHVIDFAAARARIAQNAARVDGDRVPSADDAMRREASSRRFRAEALALPRPWHAAVLREEYDTGTIERARAENTLAIKLQERRLGIGIVRYANTLPLRLRELEDAIDELREAEKSDRSTLPVKRRALTYAKRSLLALLFRYGRRRIDWTELELDQAPEA